MIRDKVGDEDIISATMASTGLSADWVKNKVNEVKAQNPPKEGLLQKGARGLSNIFNF